MSDTAQEPSMEEILASIRRIISADSEESPAAAAVDGDDDVLDLSAMEAPAEAAQEPVDAPGSEPDPEPTPEPDPEPAPEPDPVAPEPDPEPAEPTSEQRRHRHPRATTTRAAGAATARRGLGVARTGGRNLRRFFDAQPQAQ